MTVVNYYVNSLADSIAPFARRLRKCGASVAREGGTNAFSIIWIVVFGDVSKTLLILQFTLTSAVFFHIFVCAFVLFYFLFCFLYLRRTYFTNYFSNRNTSVLGMFRVGYQEVLDLVCLTCSCRRDSDRWTGIFVLECNMTTEDQVIIHAGLHVWYCNFAPSTHCDVPDLFILTLFTFYQARDFFTFTVFLCLK